uniref:Uncharacterized protein n=1 Tax=Arundo donax TaxID=35708 RepID=A0A0A9BXI8_ARUDO
MLHNKVGCIQNPSAKNCTRILRLKKTLLIWKLQEKLLFCFQWTAEVFSFHKIRLSFSL